MDEAVEGKRARETGVGMAVEREGERQQRNKGRRMCEKA